MLSSVAAGVKEGDIRNCRRRPRPWTTPLPRDNPLLVDFESAEATVIGDLDLGDYTKIPNPLSLGGSPRPCNLRASLERTRDARGQHE
jgi:hypothetical protein